MENTYNIVDEARKAYFEKRLLRFLMLRSQAEIYEIYKSMSDDNEDDMIIKEFASEFIMDQKVLGRRK